MEENQVVDTEVKPQEEAKVDPYVAKATEMGWRPQEEWTGDPEDFIEAKEFVRRQPLFDKINEQHKALKRLEQSFEALKTHHSRVKESEYNRALEQLKKAKRQALVDGETNQALEIEDRIDDIQAQKKEFESTLPDTPAPVVENPTFDRWRLQNSWYQRDAAMTAYADKIGTELNRRGLSMDEVLQQVSQEVKKEFKHKFENPKRDRVGSVEGGSRRAAVTESSIEAQMSDEERQIMNRILRTGAITKEAYLKEYKESL